MKKIMFFDIDGTLLPEREGSLIPESTVSALKKARSCGHLLYINTGRPAVNVDSSIKSLGFDGYVYGCGTMVVCGGRELYYHTLPQEKCLETVRLLRECDVCPMFERRDTVLFDFDMPLTPMISRIRGEFAAQGKNVGKGTGDDDFSFDKFIICFKQSSDMERVKHELGKDYFWIDRGGEFAEIVPKPCSKASGIELVLKHHGITKENAYAVGDSLNDLPMFSAVGTGIAMGNGKALIPYADYTTDDIDHDGIYNMLEHFGFFTPAE